MASRIDEEVFGLEVSVDVTKLVQRIDRAEHFSNIEASMAIRKDTSIVE